MTTVYKHKMLMLSFQGRSPKEIYADSCEEHHVRIQKSLYEELSALADDFGKLQHLLCAEIAFGVRGSLALMPIIQVSRNLRRVDLKGCGLTDEFVTGLVEALQEHPTIRTIDLSNNPFITVHSGRGLVKMAELNPNIVSCALEGTHVGANVARVIASRCESNRVRLTSYFADDYFRMKDLFNAVDADGSGWVHIKNIVGSVSAPILQERLVERIALKRPKKRSDNCIHVNTFMELVYLNYKTLLEINERCQDVTTDVTAMNIKRNWKRLLVALEKHSLNASLLNKVRIRDVLLSELESMEIIDHAVTIAADEAEEIAATTSGNGDQQPAAPTVEARHVMHALKQMFPPMPLAPKTYGFLKERPDDYISPLLRNGSRCISITDVSSASATPALSTLGEEDEDPVHTWRLPPVMVRAVIDLFASNKEMSVDQLLDGSPATELEYLRLSGLCGKFAQYSIPTDVSMITVQEVVNMVDEYYDVLRVDKHFTLDQIKEMCSQVE
mmetsp:Transcript_35766/g.41721  ORF Transcript_35766/g.41721 Transcript_35766/m.41721 type:complete len:500 (-) Transcript_35766:224-1723(-)